MEFEVTARIPKQPFGWLETELPKSVMTKLQSYIKEAKKNPVNHNSNLAGNISESFLIKDKNDYFFQTVLLPHIGKFNECYPSYDAGINVCNSGCHYCLDRFWVNFQKENEFNPLHDHGGVFSFVIWVKIPTDWREQHALPISANSNAPSASNFEFHYTTMLGNSGKYSYFLDKKSEGTMIFFPAKLMHTVYPFYNCDKERVSISGNINLDISENSMKQFRSQARYDKERKKKEKMFQEVIRENNL